MICHPPADESSTSTAATNAFAPLPPGLALMEQATLAVRAFLRAAGLDEYAVFHAHDLDLDDIDLHLPDLDPRAALQPLPLVADACQPHTFDGDRTPPRLEPAGVLHLPRHGVLLARWHMVGPEYAERQTFRLAAAASAEAFQALHRAVIDRRRKAGEPVWQIFRDVHRQETRPRQPLDWSDLLLPPVILSRVEAELLGFFTEPVAGLYRSLRVPYRRGVLMHGPPGNGKTSIIRALGSALPDVPAIILRAAVGFDDDDLQTVFRRWTEHAPALLVIEDLDHMLKLVDFSQFLNLIDGIEGSLTGGLLLVATTNHPDLLDPALNNRPGRFDVVIEVPCPTADLRRRFFDAHASELDEPTVRELTTTTAGLSFAHLQEVLRLAGLLAVRDGVTRRMCGHIAKAADMVCDAHRSAQFGFPSSPENPFGLAQFRRRD